MFFELVASVIFFNMMRHTAFIHKKRQNDFYVKKKEEQFLKEKAVICLQLLSVMPAAGGVGLAREAGDKSR